MIWHSIWLTHKRDQRGKNHIYGSIELDNGHIYRIYGECSSGHIHMRRIDFAYHPPRSTRLNKIQEGYKDISVDKIKSSYPEVIRDIEAQFALKVLTNAL